MTNNRENCLTHLRSIESTKQWNECLKSARFLLQHSTEEASVRMLLAQVKRFLNDTQKIYPNDEDIRAALTKLKDVKSFKSLLLSSVSLMTILEKHTNEPGINNFRNAIQRLMRLETIEPLSSDYYDTFMDALAGILMGILDQHWGRNNPDLWQRSFLQETHEDAFIRVKYFWSSPEIVGLNKELWRQVADDIEVGNF